MEPIKGMKIKNRNLVIVNSHKKKKVKKRHENSKMLLIFNSFDVYYGKVKLP